MHRKKEVLPISAVIPTFNRPRSLQQTLDSLGAQNALPAQLIVIDGSPGEETRMVIEAWAAAVGSQCEVVYQRAFQIGAAVQRNQGVANADQPFIWFFDDDILFESDCVERLWAAIKGEETLGGVNALITNQCYTTPGRVTRTLFRLLEGKSRESYAGKCIGPALNILPDDSPDLPDVVPVEWLNTTCALYRREALPSPPFDSHFTGYSFMEDVALSLSVGTKWKLRNARTARIYHDSQPAEYKGNGSALARMELINRHYVMTRILGRTSAVDYAKLVLLETFGIVTPLVSARAWRSLPAVLIGKASAIVAMLPREKIVGASLRGRPFLRPVRGAHRGTPLQSAENRADLKSNSVVTESMKVLIGITTHNRADILSKSIQSALDQNYSEKEVAVFDDASSDDTPLLRSRFPDVTWYRVEKNEGYLAARNQLMRETDADFYFSLDDDAWFIRGDEISLGVELMERRSEVAALACDILTANRPDVVDRLQPLRTHTFIGCGHLLRLSAVREVGYYTPNPGFYGAEEKDLCVQLLDKNYEILFLPGVHVWHEKSTQARDLSAQHRSGVCNDFVFALRRCPLPMALWLIPGKVVSHLRFAVTNDLLRPCLKGMAMFCAALPSVALTRRPVSSTTFHEYLRRSRASA